MRESQSSTFDDHSKKTYKSSSGARTSADRRRSTLDCFSRSTLVVVIGIMVSAWLIIRALPAFAPLTSVCAQYEESPKLPLLLDATGEELTAGLELGQFTSVDLIEVSPDF